MSSDIRKKNAQKREKDNIRTRNGSLIFLAIGTALASMMIGKSIAIRFDFNIFFYVLSQIICVVFGYITIDSAVRNNLLAASDNGEDEGLKRYFSRKAITSLLFTVVFSLGASWFVGQFSKGESNYVNYNAQVDTFSKRDSTNKALAANTLKEISANEKKDIENAKNKAKQLVADVVKKGSKSWREDYKSAKNNPSHWLWTCKGKSSGCPKSYRDWRDEILEAHYEGEKLILDASENNSAIKRSISESFAYQVNKDSTLASLKVHTETMEAERNKNAWLITSLIILITLAAALSAWSANKSVEKIRKVYGQQVEESDQIFIDVLEDLCLRFLAITLGIINGLFVFVDNQLNKIGIDIYEIRKRSIATIYQELKEGVDGTSKPQIQSSNLEIGQKPIQATVPVSTPLLSKKETDPTHVGTRLEALEEKPTTVEKPSVTTVETPTVVISNDFPTSSTTVEQPLNIVVNKGLKYVIWNGHKRDAAWVKKQISAYIGKRNDKIRRKKSHNTEDTRISQLTEVLQRLEK